MYTRYYDSYPSDSRHKQNTGEVINNTPEEIADIKPDPPQNNSALASSDGSSSTASLLPFGGGSGFKGDDILLIAILLLVMSESRDDGIMPLILGYLLLGNGF